MCPGEDWEPGTVKRIFIDLRPSDVPMDVMLNGEMRDSVEVYKDWIEKKDVEWPGGMFASFLPTIPG